MPSRSCRLLRLSRQRRRYACPHFFVDTLEYLVSDDLRYPDATGGILRAVAPSAHLEDDRLLIVQSELLQLFLPHMGDMPVEQLSG